ncbi:10956_t:CDS:2 [Ambispora leptoticha]|uniref:glycine hydroxymethyltransferase n=1 Tax=Ambispora leptoticha TaxID=144679 RepID=A0A9N8VLJ1_9GLOM|nr:10956_t:CDS:2 [Ambispora leptoticha]
MFQQTERDENNPEMELEVYYCDEHKEEASKSSYKWTMEDSKKKLKKEEERKIQEERQREEVLNKQKNLFFLDGRTDKKSGNKGGRPFGDYEQSNDQYPYNSNRNLYIGLSTVAGVLAGCQYVDEIEKIAIDLAKKIFKVEYANVQPHSGSQANQAVYLTLLKPSDRILSLDLLAGGHLSHGAKINFSGNFYQVYHYNLDPTTQKLNYEAVRKIAKEVKPRLIITGYSSYSLKIDFAKFREIADEVGSYLLADIAHVAGLVSVGLFPDPSPYADVITFTTHKTLRGPRGGVILAKKELGEKIDKAVFPGLQGGANQAIIAAKVQCFYEVLQPEFKSYQKKVLENAKVMADYFCQKGAKVISDSTETHLLIIDTKSSYSLTGKEAAKILEEVGIVWFGEKEFKELAENIHFLLQNPDKSEECGIKQIFYSSDKHHKKLETIAAKKMFNDAGIKYSLIFPLEIIIKDNNIQSFKKGRAEKILDDIEAHLRKLISEKKDIKKNFLAKLKEIEKQNKENQEWFEDN